MDVARTHTETDFHTSEHVTLVIHTETHTRTLTQLNTSLEHRRTHSFLTRHKDVASIFWEFP